MFHRKFIFAIFFLLCFSAKAQLDLEHWFPPVFRSASSPVTQFYLYLSTDKATPFKVKIFNNNQVIDSVMVSKGSPVEYKILNYQLIYATAERLTMNPQKAGLHLAGEKSFYASLRIAGSRSTVISSKGKSALGMEFFAGMEQVINYGEPRSGFNYQICVMATQDNTRVKLSDYDNRVVFADGSTSDELNFMLNKGETYMIVALKKDADPSLAIDDFEATLIGAKLSSDKPVVLINGNFEGQYFGEPGGDITLDQSIPTDKIGKEYFLVSAMTPYKFPTERALIIATKNNTKVFFNDDSQPTRTLNAGEHFFTSPYLPVKFIKGNIPVFTNKLGKEIETGGMYIKSTEPVYVYQLSGGLWDRPPPRVQDRTFGPEGLLLSFPLDKNYLADPRQNLENMIQIPFVNNIGSVQFETKISVKAPNDANIKLNGYTPSSSQMIGKPGWSYFTASLVSGGVEITAEKGINVDVVGGKPATGFGSSYTSFSNDPFIIINGNCVQEGVFLTLNNSQFEGIQWQIDGINISGANSPSFEPKIAGIYTCVLSYSGFKFTTSPISVEDCPYSISTINLGDVCQSFNVKPQFSPPRENLDVVKIEILTKPQNGSVVIADGILKTNINNMFNGADRFVYKVTSASGYYEVIKIEFKVLPGPVADILEEIRPKNVLNKIYYYNLLSAIIAVNNENFSFFETQSDAENSLDSISSPENYMTGEPTQVFVRVLHKNGCFTIRKILLLLPYPSVDDGNLFPKVLTPNADGFNDVWNYSVLKIMENVQIQIYDRYGKSVYTHEASNINFTWDGMGFQQRKLKTQTLWVVYSYFDPVVRKMYQGSQWILLKNR